MGLFPCLPGWPGHSKRLRKLTAAVCWLIRALATDASLWADDVLVVDSTPVECGRSKETVRRSDLAGWAEYGYWRCLWGPRLHLLAIVGSLPVRFALTGARADERRVLLSMLDDPALAANRAGQIIIADKNYYGRDFETALAGSGMCLLRPARNGESKRPGTRFFKPLRQITESVNDTSKASSTWSAAAATRHSVS